MIPKIRCLIVDDEAIAREILENHLSRIDSVEVVASCKNALEAFQVINKSAIDLIFLDINMPEISGLSFAKSMTKEIKVIFTTAYREYAVDGFDLMAVDYLLKPISFERLIQAINKYSAENADHHKPTIPSERASEEDTLFVRADRKMIRIRFEEVIYIESIGDYLKIHLKDRTVVTRETLASIKAKLPERDFFKIHRSYLVAVKYIDSYTNEFIGIGKIQLPISRGCKDEVIRRLQKD
jgi:two-component system LytT family response regulator